MISIEGVTKRFRLRREKTSGPRVEQGGTINAVDHVTLTCRPGRVFSLLGPNGAGKTTLLRMVATMLRPTTGRISVAGFDTVTEQQEVRGRIGFLTGTTGLYERLTPFEIIGYYGELHGLDRAQLKRRRDMLFQSLGIDGFADRRIGRLSSGMRQKVSIARTMIHDPEVVVFDEPTVGLDVITAKSIISLIRRCRDEGKTVIFSTHIMGEVSLLSDDLAIMHKGRLLYSGGFREFSENMSARSIEDQFIRLVEEV